MKHKQCLYTGVRDAHCSRKSVSALHRGEQGAKSEDKARHVRIVQKAEEPSDGE